jgi:hypothetical protein
MQLNGFNRSENLLNAKMVRMYFRKKKTTVFIIKELNQ